MPTWAPPGGHIDDSPSDGGQTGEQAQLQPAAVPSSHAAAADPAAADPAVAANFEDSVKGIDEGLAKLRNAGDGAKMASSGIVDRPELGFEGYHVQVAKGLVDDTSAGGHTFAVGVDGSRLCYHAVDFACCFLERRAHRLKPTGQADKLYGFHVSPPPTRHSATSYALAPHILQRKCAKEGEKYGEVNMEWFDEEEHADSTIGDTLCHMSSEKRVQFLIVGLFGHSGSAKRDDAIVGDVSDRILKERTSADVFVIKNMVALPKRGKPETWCVSTDGSPNSRHALDVALSMMAPHDKLYVLHLARFESFAKRIKDRHMAEVKRLRGEGSDSEFVVKTLEHGLHVGELICNFCERRDVHILVVGHQGHSRVHDTYEGGRQGMGASDMRKIGSTGGHCVENAHCAVLICKTEGKHNV